MTPTNMEDYSNNHERRDKMKMYCMNIESNFNWNCNPEFIWSDFSRTLSEATPSQDLPSDLHFILTRDSAYTFCKHLQPVL